MGNSCSSAVQLDGIAFCNSFRLSYSSERENTASKAQEKNKTILLDNVLGLQSLETELTYWC